MYLYCHVYAVKPPLLDTPLRTPLRINSFLLRTLSITNTLFCTRLSDTGTSPLRTSLLFGHLFITDTSLLTLSITDTHLVWSLLRTPVLCENLSVTGSFMETSLLRTPLYCKYPYLWYGHVFITDTSQSLLQTPINCRHHWYGDVFITDIAYYKHHPYYRHLWYGYVFITDSSHMYFSITDSIMDTSVVQTSPYYRQLYHSLISNRGGLV